MNMDEINQALRMSVEPYIEAEDQFGILIKTIREFEETLKDDEEMVLSIPFGGFEKIHVEIIGIYEPNIVWFYGVDGALNRVQLIQHVTQLSFLLRAQKKQEPTKPYVPIGFLRPPE